MKSNRKPYILICIVICIILLCLALVACVSQNEQTPVTPPSENIDKPLEKPKPDTPSTATTLTIHYSDMGQVISVEYYNQDIIVLPTPRARLGYTFLYWLSEDGNPIMSSTIFNNSSYDTLRLTADWKTIDYTLTLNYNDGKVDTEKRNYNIESETYTLPVPFRIGYKFLGWYNGSYTAPLTELGRGTSGNLTLTAKWKTETYTITYRNAGDTFSGKEEYNITTKDFTLPIPTKERCKFLGWYRYGDFSGDNLSSVAQGSSGNLTLYAKWSAPLYNVRYEMFGGSSPLLVTSYSTDTQSINLDKIIPAKDGHQFLGWYQHPDCIAQELIFIDKKDTVDYTLFASWKTKEATTNIQYSNLICKAPNKESLNLSDHADCHYTVTGVLANYGNIFNIAAVYKSKPVTEIERLAFQALKGATVNVPSSVYTIGDEAFRDCIDTTLKLPTTIKSIGKRCFFNASALSTNIPSNVGDKLGVECFAKSKNCNFNFIDGVTAIPDQAFSLASISQIILPTSIESIGDNAFAGANITSRIKLGGKISFWGGGLFTNSHVNRLDIDSNQSSITFTTLLDLYNFETDFSTPISISKGLTNYVAREIYFRIMGFYNPNFGVKFNCSTVNSNPSLLGHYSSNAFSGHSLEEVCITQKLDTNYNGINGNCILDIKSINTIVHETRHYFQNLCYKKKIKSISSSKIPYALQPSAQELSTWNPDDYISASNSPEKYPEYYHQPVEEDARRAATEISGYLPKHTPCRLCPYLPYKYSAYDYKLLTQTPAIML